MGAAALFIGKCHQQIAHLWQVETLRVMSQSLSIAGLFSFSRPSKFSSHLIHSSFLWLKNRVALGTRRRNFDNKTSGFFFSIFYWLGWAPAVPYWPLQCDTASVSNIVIISNKVTSIPTPRPHHFFSHLLFFRPTLCGLFFLALALLYYSSAT
jgi:hypothetical protein